MTITRKLHIPQFQLAMHKSMPSRLRQSISPDDSFSATAIIPQRTQPSYTPTSKSTSTRTTVRQRQTKNMSLTHTYRVAATARSKLGSEAGRPNHRLRHLVGHANLLDSLMLELADAERQQEQWFDETVKNATANPASTASIPSTSASMQHVRWTDTEVEDPDEDAIDEDDDDDDDTSSDSTVDYDEDAEEIIAQLPLIRIRSPPVQITTMEVTSSHDKPDTDLDVYDEDEDIYFDDEEYDEAHALVRINSHSNPPELIHDDEASASSSDDDDEAVSPLPLSTQQQERLSEDLGLTYRSKKIEKSRMGHDLSHAESTVQPT